MKDKQAIEIGQKWINNLGQTVSIGSICKRSMCTSFPEEFVVKILEGKAVTITDMEEDERHLHSFCDGDVLLVTKYKIDPSGACIEVFKRQRITPLDLERMIEP